MLDLDAVSFSGSTYVVRREVIYVILVLVVCPVVHNKLVDGIRPKERCYRHPVNQNHCVSEQLPQGRCASRIYSAHPQSSGTDDIPRHGCCRCIIRRSGGWASRGMHRRWLQRVHSTVVCVRKAWQRLSGGHGEGGGCWEQDGTRKQNTPPNYSQSTASAFELFASSLATRAGTLYLKKGLLWRRSRTGELDKVDTAAPTQGSTAQTGTMRAARETR